VRTAVYASIAIRARAYDENGPMALVTVSDLEHLTVREFTPTEASAASFILGWVNAELEAHLERSIEEADHVETISVLDPDPTAPLYMALTYTPIKTVTSLTIDGTAMATGDYMVDRSGIVLYSRGYVAARNRTLVVAYRAGLGEPARTQLAGCVARRAMRLLQKRSDDAIGSQTANVEGYDVTFLGEGWTDEEQKIVSRWRRSVGATFPIGTPMTSSLDAYWS
jgi:hypothetical protein